MLEIKQLIVTNERELFRLQDAFFKPGEFVGIIGANGSGKSTFLNMLIHPDKIAAGHLLWNGRDWSEFREKERAKYVTLIDNHFLGYAHLKTSEYIEFGRIPYTGFTGILSEDDRQVIQTVVRDLNLQDLLNKPTAHLSDGERQRAGIARALAQETPVILLDEPTAFLDFPTKKEVMKRLRAVAENTSRLVLMSSHDLELCLEFCTRLLVIKPDQTATLIDSDISFEQLTILAFGKDV